MASLPPRFCTILLLFLYLVPLEVFSATGFDCRHLVDITCAPGTELCIHNGGCCNMDQICSSRTRDCENIFLANEDKKETCCKAHSENDWHREGLQHACCFFYGNRTLQDVCTDKNAGEPCAVSCKENLICLRANNTCGCAHSQNYDPIFQRCMPEPPPSSSMTTASHSQDSATPTVESSSSGSACPECICTPHLDTCPEGCLTRCVRRTEEQSVRINVGGDNGESDALLQVSVSNPDIDTSGKDGRGDGTDPENHESANTEFLRGRTVYRPPPDNQAAEARDTHELNVRRKSNEHTGTNSPGESDSGQHRTSNENQCPEESSPRAALTNENVNRTLENKRKENQNQESHSSTQEIHPQPTSNEQEQNFGASRPEDQSLGPLDDELATVNTGASIEVGANQTLLESQGNDADTDVNGNHHASNSMEEDIASSETQGQGCANTAKLSDAVDRPRKEKIELRDQGQDTSEEVSTNEDSNEDDEIRNGLILREGVGGLPSGSVASPEASSNNGNSTDDQT